MTVIKALAEAPGGTTPYAERSFGDTTLGEESTQVGEAAHRGKAVHLGETADVGATIDASETAAVLGPPRLPRDLVLRALI
jgi:hypothetical protein